jgi:hypothetical protein
MTNFLNTITQSGRAYSIKPNPPEVFLPPIQDSYQDDDVLEPQWIRIRSPNNGYTYLDFSHTQQSPDGTFFLASSNSSLFQQRIRRITWLGSFLDFLIPNVNPKNDTFVFTTTGSDSFTAVLADGFYNDPIASVTALVAALNAAGSPVTFSFTQLPNSVFFTITGTGTFSFIGGNGIINGQYLFGIQPNTPLATSLIIGPVLLYYTRYISFNSRTLSQFQKNQNSGLNLNTSTNIFRYYLNAPYYSAIRFHEGGLRWWNIKPDITIQSVDIQLLDEFNQPLYLPPYRYGTLNTIIVLLTEL